MCGISGFFGNKKLDRSKLISTLNLMKYRGPDHQSYKEYEIKNKKLYILHSRLSIIDLEPRSNQPFESDGFAIVFNGEIYNHLDIKKNLINKGVKFKTQSDTEVLLKSYITYGTKCVEYFEGMWSFAIFDKKKKLLFISRDRFGEKPLFYLMKNNNFYFGSEIKFIKSLLSENLIVNYSKLRDFLNYGYKFLKKDNNLFFKDIKELKPGCNIIFSENNFKINKYWKPKIKTDNKLSEVEIIDKAKVLLTDAVKKTTRSDVPIAFTLSGGVDSASLVSIASKILNLKFKTYSIIDDDERYDERKNINKIVNDLKCDNKKVKLKFKNNLQTLEEIIYYHEKPLTSIAQLNHYLLMKEIKKDGIKVCINGTMADEIYAGYLDHHLQFFSSILDKKYLTDEIKHWKKNVMPSIRNPYFRKYNLYSKNPNYRSHIYDNHDILEIFLKKRKKFKFTEKKFSSNLLRNRMLNEIFYENTPQILYDEDLNSMRNSIENRSPFINKQLFEFLFSIQTKHLIKNGFKKSILRKSMNRIVNNKILWNYKKMGFNSSIETIFNFKDKNFKEYVLNKNSDIYQIVDYYKFQKLFSKKSFPNHLSKFIFNVIGCKIFLEKDGK